MHDSVSFSITVEGVIESLESYGWTALQFEIKPVEIDLSNIN